MALWGKTETLADTPKWVARSASFLSSEAAVVSTADDTINILTSGTGFATGDAVKYTVNGGTAIAGLTADATYTVRVVGAGVVELYDTYAHAIDLANTTGRKNLTAVGVGTHTLQRTTAANAFGDHVNNGRIILFVDSAEAQVEENKAKGITGAGWWAYRTYTDAQSVTRHKAECLVAISVSASAAGDAEDTVTVDLVFSISAQPEDTTVIEGDTATFAVTVDTNATEVDYQWMKSDDAGDTWNAIVGANSDTYETAALTVEDDDGDLYRVVVTVGEQSITSDTVTLTVTAE